ncbi:flowering time control protein FPA [Pistacia vera]|uniref:flowering time control protein FPA n=1 Tax=Pistacia vera TaxID=55513 RepID=UPI0012632A0E|nr:flowering time control protein FPA [Pistacia vera]
MSSRGGGRDRFRPRFEDKTHGSGGGGGRANAPPSRHLWVGNLSHNIEESDLTDQFLRFGELESVAFQPGRSYAFVNFKRDEDAIASMKALQDFPLAGNPLRIEFAKADKSSVLSRDADHLQHRDEQRSALRGSPFSQRDSRARHASPPDSTYPDKSKMSDKSAEPSEVLWIGFPALLKVDEVILRKAFSPFGEIEKITVFPGRSYAFVQFKSLMSACRAKETLQGKLFGNPRVHICFAKSEAGSSNSGRGLMNVPLSPHFKLNGHSSPAENFRPDRNFGSFSGDPSIRSPHLNPNLDSGDPDVYNFNRKDTLWIGGNNIYEPWRLGDVGSEPGLSQDIYEQNISPTRERTAHFHEFPQKFPEKSPLFEDQWDSPEDAYYHPGAKKLKTGSLHPDKELPEYPFSDLEHGKRAFSRTFSDFAQPETFEKNFDAGPYGYKQIPDRQVNLALPHREKNDLWKAPYDGYQVGPGSLPLNSVERKRYTPELDQPKPSIKDWKWEGTIAKGGSPVCHARCFPVGKVMDMMLPEFLDCTARTGLDMLAKHYYQASSSWVVFFVPGSDADIAFYNEFMHYLEEKQRAAVAKLDDKTTLFLVPPSDFSEKVLKVPGKLSISGVVLRLEPSASNHGSLHYPNEIKDTNMLSFNSDASYLKPSTPSGCFPSLTSYPDMGKSGLSFSGDMLTSALPSSHSSSVHAVGSISESYSENRHEYPHHQRNPTWAPDQSPHHQQNPVSGSRNIPSLASNSSIDPIIQGHPSVMPKAVQEISSSQYPGGITGIPLSENSKVLHQEFKPSTLPMPITSLQPDQLAQLASTLLGPQRQLGNTPNASTGENLRQMTAGHQFDNQVGQPQSYALQNNQLTEFSISQFGQVQQLQQQLSNVPAAVPPTIQREFQSGGQGNQQVQNAGSQEADADPQKRLQATLHLAAALLQQIQRGKGT